MKVKCINNKHQEKQLTIGKVYTVKKVSGKNNDEYIIEADDGMLWRMSVKRFEVVED